MKQETFVHSKAYPLSSPRENLNSERKVPLINPIGKEQQPSIIESRSLKLMISIKKGNPNPQANLFPKHLENASTVEREVILEQSVSRRRKPLSTLQSMTKLVRMRSSNSQNSTTQNSESSNSSSDHDVHQIYQSSSEPSRASSSSSSGPDVGMACKDSCCRNKTINVLSKHEEFILDLIELIEDPVIKA